MKISNPLAVTLANPRHKKRHRKTHARRHHAKKRHHAPVMFSNPVKKHHRRHAMKIAQDLDIKNLAGATVGFFAANIAGRMIVNKIMPGSQSVAVPTGTGDETAAGSTAIVQVPGKAGMVKNAVGRVAVAVLLHVFQRKIPMGRALAHGAALNVAVGLVHDLGELNATMKHYVRIGEGEPGVEMGEIINGMNDMVNGEMVNGEMINADEEIQDADDLQGFDPEN